MFTHLALGHYGGRYRSHDPYMDYLIFHWLWVKLRWWSLAVYSGVMVVLGALRAAFGGNGA